VAKTRVRKILYFVACLAINICYGSATDPMEPERVESIGMQSNSIKEIVSSYKLSLILINGDKRTAVINGEIKNEGDAISGLIVSRINQDSVVLINKNRRLVLNLIDNHGRE